MSIRAFLVVSPSSSRNPIGWLGRLRHLGGGCLVLGLALPLLNAQPAIAQTVPREYVYWGDQVLVTQQNFADVPVGHGDYGHVNTVANLGITVGCGGDDYKAFYCPDGVVTRDQMAVFVLRSKEGSGYTPQACGTPAFADVPASSPYCPWIEELARRGVVSGCGGGNYCPANPVTEEQMSVFLLRTENLSANPPACSPPNTFGDVPETSGFCRWIEELDRRGINKGCGGGNFCPARHVTRGHMAGLLVRTFNLR